MKTYRGIRAGENNFVGDTSVMVENESLGAGIAIELSPNRSLQVRNHSPTGFNWGYGGSGPAQLALALLLDCAPSQALAEKYYHDFKNDFVCRWSDRWEITEAEILAWLSNQETKKS